MARLPGKIDNTKSDRRSKQFMAGDNWLDSAEAGGAVSEGANSFDLKRFDLFQQENAILCRTPLDW